MCGAPPASEALSQALLDVKRAGVGGPSPSMKVIQVGEFMTLSKDEWQGHDFPHCSEESWKVVLKLMANFMEEVRTELGLEYQEEFLSSQLSS